MTVTKAAITKDAKEFGNHFKQGGWRLGLLVARNVVVSARGRPPKGPEEEKTSGVVSKVSATEFAEKAGVAQSHVSYYLKAWELAAKAGYCMPSKDLDPGDEDGSLEFDEDDEDSRALWTKFYREARTPAKAKPKAEPKTQAKQRDLEHEDESDEQQDVDYEWTQEDVSRATSSIRHAAVVECLETVEALENKLDSLMIYGDMEPEDTEVVHKIIDRANRLVQRASVLLEAKGS